MNFITEENINREQLNTNNSQKSVKIDGFLTEALKTGSGRAWIMLGWQIVPMSRSHD